MDAVHSCGTLLTYTDIDGDFIHVAVTHAKMATGDFDFGADGFLSGDTTTLQTLGKISLSRGEIGAVSVGGDWIASNLLAGINAFTDGKIATAGDRELLGGEDSGSGPVKDNNALTSKIASIVIKGGVFGTPGLTTDTFGFGAQEIVSFKLGNVTLPLKAGVANDVFTTSKAQPIGAGLTGDGFEIHVFEV